MAPTDESGRIRVYLTGFNPLYGWATSAPATDFRPAGGYTVEWDDGWVDHPSTRWYFGGDFDSEIRAV